MPHSQPTALQQTVCKFHLDPQYHISHWGSTALGDSTLCRSPMTSPHKHKGQWRGALMFSFICAWINDWVNNRKADDLSRYRAHYYVIVMVWKLIHNHSKVNCSFRSACSQHVKRSHTCSTGYLHDTRTQVDAELGWHHSDKLVCMC